MLAQILKRARELLARISIVKSDKARGVEYMIIRMAQSGQIRGKVTEQQLIDMLGPISEQHTAKPKITYNRRRMDDSDSDFDFGLNKVCSTTMHGFVFCLITEWLRESLKAIRLG
jgi:programmed cell death protein 5